MSGPIRTIVTVKRGMTCGTWLVDVEESHESHVFSWGESAYHLRRFYLPTVYRSQRTAERAARALARNMRGVFVQPNEWT